MLAAPNDTRQHNGARGRAGKTGKAGVYAVTHVDVIPPQKDNGVAAVKQLAEDSRKHAGNLPFDVWQQTNRPNHFTVVESWGLRGAFDVHEVQSRRPEFRNKLGTMTGALYDERLYKALARCFNAIVARHAVAASPRDIRKTKTPGAERRASHRRKS